MTRRNLGLVIRSTPAQTVSTPHKCCHNPAHQLHLTHRQDGFEKSGLAAAGVLAGIAHLLIIQALLLAPVGTVAPLRYLSLVWAVVIGYGVWGDVPDQWKLAGATLVVGAGLFILHRELRKP